MAARPVWQGFVRFSLVNIKYADEVKPRGDLAPQLHGPAVPKRELDLARTLFNGLSDDAFKLTDWHNHYSDDLRKLIDAKVKGNAITVPPDDASDEPEVGDLMAVLRKSLDAAKKRSTASRTGSKSAAAKPTARPARLKMPSTAAKRKAAGRARRRA